MCFLLNTTLTPKEKLITPKNLAVQKEGERHKVDCIDVESDSTIGQNNLSVPKIKHFIKISFYNSTCIRVYKIKILPFCIKIYL